MSVPSEIPVVPFPVDRSIVNVNVMLDNFELNAQEGSASVYQYDESNALVQVDRVPIPSSIWLTWGTDDYYVIDYALGTLGLSRVV